MTELARPERPARLRIPETVGGDFTGLIIGTYGAALDFAEAQLFRQLSRHTTNRIVLADDVQLSSFLAGQASIKRLNRAYVASPVRSPRAHHPKFIVLVGPTAGRLLVGSGNLSISGYTGPGECFTSYEWDPADDRSSAPFEAVRDLLELEIGLGWIDRIARDRVRDVFAAAPWIGAEPPRAAPVVHNQRRSLIDQLEETVGERAVHEIVAVAPFHDKRSLAIKELLTRFGPDRFRLIVQEGMTRLDKAELARVFKRSNAEVVIEEAKAPSPYPNVLLHAKIVLIRAKGADFLLQGSANLSEVALCRTGAAANVEVSNLLEGEPGCFDYLLSSLELNTRSDGLSSFVPDEEWGSDEPDRQVDLGPWEVCWTPPRLSGFLKTSVGEDLLVLVGGVEVSVASQRWEESEGGWQFLLEFSSDDAARIDRARLVQLVEPDGSVWAVYPYHVLSLLRLSASGHRADLLQEVGDLDLRDKELEELIAELDRVLVVDGRSLWRLAHPEERDSTSDDDEPHVDYSELDWEKIGELPQLRQFGTSGQQHMLAQTELGIVLQALTSRFRAEVRAGGGEPADEIDDGDDLGTEHESEDADLLDDVAENSDDEAADGAPRRMAPRQRVRRLWRNFVRRFVEGLSDHEFVASVGSAVIVPSYIVFNHLCRRLRVVDLVNADFLTEAQLQLWSFMWGNGRDGGYLEGLQLDEREVARRLLADHEDLTVTLASVEDAWCHVWSTAMDVRPLRDVWRQFLTSEDWVPESGALARAAAVTNECEGDEGRLFDDLYDLATHMQDSERNEEIAERLGINRSGIEVKRSKVQRGGEAGIEEEHSYLEISGVEVSREDARDVFAIWKAFEPRQRYFRIQAPNAVAVLDLDYDQRFYFDRADGSEHVLDVGSRPAPPWEVRLEELLDAA
jgi:hypothetical protein